MRLLCRFRLHLRSAPGSRPSTAAPVTVLAQIARLWPRFPDAVVVRGTPFSPAQERLLSARADVHPGRAAVMPRWHSRVWAAQMRHLAKLKSNAGRPQIFYLDLIRGRTRRGELRRRRVLGRVHSDSGEPADRQWAPGRTGVSSTSNPYMNLTQTTWTDPGEMNLGCRPRLHTSRVRTSG
jgi:hypothetical protein